MKRGFTCRAVTRPVRLLKQEQKQKKGRDKIIADIGNLTTRNGSVWCSNFTNLCYRITAVRSTPRALINIWIHSLNRELFANVKSK